MLIVFNMADFGTRINRLKMEFSLLWDVHKNYVVETVENMYRNETFCDCRLIGASGFSLYCHKLVLSSFSPILKDIIESCQSYDLVNITLAEVTATELTALVDFMYTGETSLSAETMAGFLDLCKILKVPTFELQVVESCMLVNKPESVAPAVDDEGIQAADDWIVASGDDVAMLYANDAFLIEADIKSEEGGENALFLLDEAKVKKIVKKPLGDKQLQMKKKYNKVGIGSHNQAKNERSLEDICDLGVNHPKRYQCKKCGNKYSHKRTITHHLRRICGQPPTHACEFCNYRGKRRFQLKSHLLRFHQISIRKTSVKKKLE